MPDQNQTWKTRKQQARKLISQRDDASTYKPKTTLNTAGYDVALNGYTIYFMRHNGRIIYLGERDPIGEFS